MTIYSICHNDDDPRDPQHRRVLLTLGEPEAPETVRWLADGEPLAWFTSPERAEADLRWVYCDPAWGLREERGK